MLFVSSKKALVALKMFTFLFWLFYFCRRTAGQESLGKFQDLWRQKL